MSPYVQWGRLVTSRYTYDIQHKPNAYRPTNNTRFHHVEETLGISTELVSLYQLFNTRDHSVNLFSQALAAIAFRLKTETITHLHSWLRTQRFELYVY